MVMKCMKNHLREKRCEILHAIFEVDYDYGNGTPWDAQVKVPRTIPYLYVGVQYVASKG
jgi:hypothetical protein